jgi:outer membrane lipoprotein SlyB
LKFKLILEFFMKNIFSLFLLGLFIVTFSGCSTVDPRASLPIHYGVIVDAKMSYKPSTQSNSGSVWLGAGVGGVVGHQMGKGNGKKVMTGVGALLGAALASNSTEKSVMVPATVVMIKDDDTGALYHIMLDGNWRTGMAIRYSLVPTESGSYQLAVR